MSYEVALRHCGGYLMSSRVGSGFRVFLQLGTSGSKVRLLYVPTLTVLWAEARDIAWGKELTLYGLAKRIRAHRAERRRLKLPYSKKGVAEALELLRGSNHRSAEEEKDDLEEATSTAPDQGEEEVSLDKIVTGEAKPKKGRHTVAPETTGETAMETATETNSNSAPKKKKAAANKPKKKAAAAKKPAAPKKGGRPRLNDADIIKLKVKENPRQGAAADRFAVIKDGMTVGEYLKAAQKKGASEALAIADVRWNRDKGFIDVKAAA